MRDPKLNRRLLVTTPYFPPDPKAGGAEMFAMSLVEGLTVDHDWEVTVITTTRNGEIEDEVLPNGVTVYRLPYRFTLSNSPISGGWPREVKRIIAAVNPDVININIPVPGLGDVASLVAYGRPVVIYYHFGSMRKGNRIPDAIIWLYESLLLPISLRRARYIACGTTYVRDGILRGFRSKTSVIPPGVDSRRFHPAAHRITDPHVLYVGSLNLSDQHKRFQDLLEACAILRDELPELRLSAVGGGDGRTMCEEMVAKLGIADLVRFRGRLEGEALAQAYRDAAVLAVPSLRETFGMVITEAMASGLPVVAVNGGGVPDVVDDNKDGILVPPRNPRALADALREILADPERADALGQAGRKKVSERLEWSHQIAAMNGILVAAAELDQ
jgi:glycosyltransferase involved in cell wall biosynthesis